MGRAGFIVIIDHNWTVLDSPFSSLSSIFAYSCWVDPSFSFPTHSYSITILFIFYSVIISEAVDVDMDECSQEEGVSV